MEILKMQKNTNKKFLVFEINAFESVAVNYPYDGKNTWHWQSVG